MNLSLHSDTTATTLTHIIYELARHPSNIPKLRKELASIDPSIRPNKIHHLQLQHLDHLNGVISETLRLHPPVPTALQRLTPPEGLTIGGVFIPGNTTVWSPQYVLGRCKLSSQHQPNFLPRFCARGWPSQSMYRAQGYKALISPSHTASQVYHNPESFIPERWYSNPELIKERSAFAPFSTGKLALQRESAFGNRQAHRFNPLLVAPRCPSDTEANTDVYPQAHTVALGARLLC